MAFSKTMLRGYGLNDEQVQTIIDLHMEIVKAMQADNEAVTAENEKTAKELATLKKDFAKTQKELEEYKATIDSENNPYQQKYEDMKKKYEDIDSEYKKYKEDVEAEKAQAKKETAYKKLLKESGISDKRIESVLKLAKVDGKLDNMEFDDKGELKESDKYTESIKKDYSEYVQSERQEGASTATPPSGNGQGGGMSRATQLTKEYQANMYGTTNNSKKE